MKILQELPASAVKLKVTIANLAGITTSATMIQPASTGTSAVILTEDDIPVIITELEPT